MVSPSPKTGSEARELFLAELERIERLIGWICRRNGLVGDDADDFASWAKLRLMDDDYGALRRFQGRSSLATYLAVVLANLFRDYRVQQWGRWRPSAEAKRLGPVAVRLEALMYRDGQSVREAIQVVSSGWPGCPDESDLARLAARIPPRVTPREQAGVPEALQGAGSAEDVLLSAERATLREHALRALERAIQTLSPEERVIIRLRFWEGLAAVEIARSLGLDQKRLYRRIERMLGRLRRILEREGVDAGSVALLSTEEWSS